MIVYLKYEFYARAMNAVIQNPKSIKLSLTARLRPLPGDFLLRRLITAGRSTAAAVYPLRSITDLVKRAWVYCTVQSMCSSSFIPPWTKN
jgi:hypothetical protein